MAKRKKQTTIKRNVKADKELHKDAFLQFSYKSLYLQPLSHASHRLREAMLVTHNL